MRGAAFIDGFNIYHAVDEMGMPHLKWISYRRLAELISVGHATSMNEVVLATAYFNLSEGKRSRHELFVRAQRAKGVTIPLGHMADDDLRCPDCGWQWTKPTEKQSDVNVALSLYRAAVRDEFDVAFLLSADSDLLPAIEMVKKDAPEKRIMLVTPPNRKHSKRLRTACHGKIHLSVEQMERAVMDETFSDDNGLIVRPESYAPAPGWVHPNERPKNKPGKAPKQWGKKYTI